MREVRPTRRRRNWREVSSRELYFSEAIREAIAEEMRRDERVFLMGEDIAVYGGAFRVTKGLLDEFGPDRVRNTPISEASFVGMAAGAALLGSRPIVEIMFSDFVTLALDQILNHAAKYRYMYGTQVAVPMVLRLPTGGRRGYGPTHSQSLESLFLSMPGIKIACPSTPADAKGLLKTAVRDDNPVAFFENKTLYGRRGPVPSEDYTTLFGEARVVREGSDVTVVTFSRMVWEALEAADALSQDGIEIEVIDLRTLNPLDMDTVKASVEKTTRVIVAEEGPKTGGVGAELAARIVEEVYYYLDGPVKRVAALDTPVPASPVLEKATLPDWRDIVEAVHALGSKG